MQEFFSNSAQLNSDNHAQNHSNNNHSNKVANNDFVIAEPLNVGRAIMAASFAAPLIVRLHCRNIVFSRLRLET